MSKSYESINYALRPAKSVERKMLLDAFRHLSSFGVLSSYKYIGFGSPFFSDFILFHKSLNITDMVCVEKEEDDRDRFEFNKPFQFININFGKSSEILPSIDLNTRTIAWLDNESVLNSEILGDINWFFTRAPQGSVFVVTVNAHPIPSDGDNPQAHEAKSMKRLKEQVGEERIPLGIQGKDLRGWNNAKTLKRIIDNEIEKTLNVRNGMLREGTHIKYKQLFNFHYSDRAKMLTVGGLIYDEGQIGIFANCLFDQLEFLRFENEPYRIKIPSLTYKEIRHIDAHIMIDGSVEKKRVNFLKTSDLNNYEKIYRFFPKFAETEV